MKKVLVLDGPTYYWPHEEFGALTENLDTLRQNPKDISLVVFTGGADIRPSLYGHKQNPKTWCSDYRDTRDLEAFKLAQEHNIPCTGICRGGQFLTAMAGGYLYQHVTNHQSCRHPINTHDGQTFEVSGDHHQMFGSELPLHAKMLAWAAPSRSTVYELGDGSALNHIDREPEVILYPTIKSLAVQYHPEWMGKDSTGVRYYINLLHNLFAGAKKKGLA